MPANKFLCIMADDFGMHPAINEGIVKAFSDGILTDTNLMAPTPAIQEALALTKSVGIPVGLHATFTCDWDIYSWKPLTAAKSFVAPDGRMKDSFEAAWKDASEEEALAELYAQYRLVRSAGIQLTHVGHHMWYDKAGKFNRVMNTLITKENLPYRGSPMVPEFPFALQYAWQSDFYLSDPAVVTLSAARDSLKKNLAALTPGYHIWVTHPAIDHESLDRLCTVNSPARNWARTYRALDLALLLDPETADWIHSHGIQIVPVAKCPVLDVREHETIL